MTLNGVIANRRVISPNSVALCNGHDLEVFMYVAYLDQANALFCISLYVYGVVVNSSRSLSHLLMSFLLKVLIVSAETT